MMVQIIRQNYRDNKHLFNQIKRQLLNILGDEVVIEHVGSTAIPKMSGKNIIDVLVEVSEISGIEKAARIIEKLGYFRGKENFDGDYVFLASKETETGSGDIHIHLVIKNSERSNDFLLLRNYLLDNPNIAKGYSEYKDIANKIAKNNRRNYKKIKAGYVDNLLKEARKYGKIS
jgi:GrpB-like predicted nucleotidyltransferase (UPF0157 family)